MNNTMKENQRKEAIKRLEELTSKFNLNQKIVEDFKNGIIYCSCNDKLHDVTTNNRFYKKVKKFEEEYNATVYYCFLDRVYYGFKGMTLFTLLFVSNNEEEWETERVEENYIFSYVYNLTYKECSEFGDVFICGNYNGILVRLR